MPIKFFCKLKQLTNVFDDNYLGRLITQNSLKTRMPMELAGYLEIQHSKTQFYEKARRCAVFFERNLTIFKKDWSRYVKHF